MKKEICEFVVLPEHLKLLSQVYWRWQDCEFGAPEIDPKRPFGNSNVEYDLVEIFHGVVSLSDHDYELKDAYPQLDKYVQWYRELHIVLQIICTSGKFEPGLYRKISKSFMHEIWEKVS
jgi:hypothetical protein